MRHLIRHLAIAAVLAGMCSIAHAAEPRSAFDLPTSPAEDAAREAARRSTEPGPPAKIYTCSADPDAWARPDLAEFWVMVRTAGNLNVLRDKLKERFGRGGGIIFPIAFDGCVDFGSGPQRHRTVIRYVGFSAADAQILLPRLTVDVEVVLPVREHMRRQVPVDLKIGGY